MDLLSTEKSVGHDHDIEETELVYIIVELILPLFTLLHLHYLLFTPLSVMF